MVLQSARIEQTDIADHGLEDDEACTGCSAAGTS